MGTAIVESRRRGCISTTPVVPPVRINESSKATRLARDHRGFSYH